MKTYLGDGVYVERLFDGTLKLTTENGLGVTNVIFIDLQSFLMLKNFVAQTSK